VVLGCGVILSAKIRMASACTTGVTRRGDFRQNLRRTVWAVLANQRLVHAGIATGLVQVAKVVHRLWDLNGRKAF
jgi:hypothetical protein